jgi:hypothetical protein
MCKHVAYCEPLTRDTGRHKCTHTEKERGGRVKETMHRYKGRQTDRDRKRKKYKNDRKRGKNAGIQQRQTDRQR